MRDEWDAVSKWIKEIFRELPSFEYEIDDDDLGMDDELIRDTVSSDDNTEPDNEW